jgi:hypothetical protein
MYGGRVQIFRDEQVSKKTADVFGQMAEIFKQFEPEPKYQPVDKFNTLPLISVEQAMKELLELENEANKKES